jgi:hypothetical protein
LLSTSLHLELNALLRGGKNNLVELGQSFVNGLPVGGDDQVSRL